MDYKEKNFVSAVIYVHNAGARAGVFLGMVRDVLDENFEHSEIICVNDSSDDGSLDIIRRTAAEKEGTGPSISVVNMSYFHGLELSMDAGVDLAIGDFVFEFDNTVPDFDPRTIMDVYTHSLEGYDIVSASPDRKEKLSSRIFYKVFDRYADVPYRMSTESFRVLSRRVINRISSMNKTVPYRKALYANCGLKTDSIKYPVTAPDAGMTDSREKSYRSVLAADSLILFTNMGYRLSMAMTIIMMLITIFIGVYTLITYFTINPVEGWTTTVLFISVCFFGLFAILTIIVKYLQLLVDMVFKRKHYSFESIEKLN